MVHILFRAGKKSRVRFYFPPPLFFSLHPYYFLLLPRRQNPILLHRKKSLLRSPPPLLLHRCCYKRKGPLEKSPLSPAISSTVAALLQSPPLLLFSCNLTINQTLHYDGDVKELCLDFTVTEESVGKRHIIELKPGGKDVYVTNENKLQYVHTMADYKLNRQILPLSNAFYRGLTDLIAPSWLKLFNASEFNQ